MAHKTDNWHRIYGRPVSVEWLLNTKQGIKCLCIGNEIAIPPFINKYSMKYLIHVGYVKIKLFFKAAIKIRKEYLWLKNWEISLSKYCTVEVQNLSKAFPFHHSAFPQSCFSRGWNCLFRIYFLQKKRYDTLKHDFTNASVLKEMKT